VFNEFKKGVEAELANDDYQTRYDLAIAYHEMGLAEDAFREMINSMRGALRQKDYVRAGEIMSALLYFHDDSASAIRGMHKVISEVGV
jgi:thioredoxin-like negative regulator of GroEL